MLQAGNNWRPSASREALVYRARLLGRIRAFFNERGFLEVQTPLLADTTTSDPHVQSIVVDCMGQQMWLQTSPEQHMKRLLAAGVGDCYQIGTAMRGDEVGKHHNPEFTMLEWYRLGQDLPGLMDECCALIDYVQEHQPKPAINCLSYTQAWQQHLPGNPHSMSAGELRELLPQDEQAQHKNLATDQLRDLLFAISIQPQLIQPVLIHSFPVDSCAMARQLREETPESGAEYMVAARCELYWKGLEVLNGYHELLDANELRQRYQQDCRIRQARAMPSVVPPRRLLAAMESGLPPCAGAALGIDRLLMCLSGVDAIGRVMAFTFNSA